MECVKPCCFELKKAKPKVSTYVLSFSLGHGRDPQMIHWNSKLKSDFNALPLKSKYTGYDIFRILGNEKELSDFYDYRKLYFKYVYLQLIVCSLIFVSVNLFLSLVSSSVFLCSFFAVCFVASLLFFAYYLCAFFVQHNKCKRIDELKRKKLEKIIRSRDTQIHGESAVSRIKQLFKFD